MLIKKIEMLNFRQFADLTSIEFSIDPIENITIIMGDNGSGKTTLAQAFLWVLYGETTFRVKEIINRDVRDAMLPGETKEVKVNLYINRDNTDYIICRRQKYFRESARVKEKNVEFFVGVKNISTGEWIYNLTESQSNILIKKMLPFELSKFFFFDGERIKVMSDEIEEGKSKDFADAVKGLVGLTAMMNAITHFKPTTSNSTVIGRFQNKIDTTGDRRLSEYTRQLAFLDSQIDELEKRIEEIEPNITRYMEQSILKKQEILSMASAIEQKRNYDTLIAELDLLKDEKTKSINVILEYFSKTAINCFSKPLIGDALTELKNSKKLDKGIPKMHADIVKFLLDRKLCICDTPLIAGSKESKALYDLLDTIPPKTIGQSIGQFADNSKSRIRASETFFSTFESFFKREREISDTIEVKTRKSTEIYHELSDTSRAQTLRTQQYDFENKAKQLSNELKLKTEDLANTKSKRGYLQSEKDKLITQDAANKENQELLEYARYIYDELVCLYKNKETIVRQELEKNINEIFTEIYDSGIKLEVDEKYNIKVFVTDISSSDNELERNTAQNYAIIFAFISGIIRMAKAKGKETETLFGTENSENADIFDEANGYPLVMDAPLSAFDKKRIHNICDTLPNIAQQVIMFIKDTDGDVAEEHLGGKIGKKWLLYTISNTKSSVVRR